MTDIFDKAIEGFLNECPQERSVRRLITELKRRSFEFRRDSASHREHEQSRQTRIVVGQSAFNHEIKFSYRLPQHPAYEGHKETLTFRLQFKGMGSPFETEEARKTLADTFVKMTGIELDWPSRENLLQGDPKFRSSPLENQTLPRFLRFLEWWRDEIRSGGKWSGSQIVFADEVTESERFIEGAVQQITVNSYERDAKARQRCIDHYGATCLVCGMDFESMYGEIGRGFIHVHHNTPLATIGAEYELDPINDLDPVCPNCHSMVHQKSPPFTIDELRRIIRRPTTRGHS